jgi:hypothetical protein
MSDDRQWGTKENPLPEECGDTTPEVVAEDTGNLSGGSYNQVHGTNKLKEERDDGR